MQRLEQTIMTAQYITSWHSAGRQCEDMYLCAVLIH